MAVTIDGSGVISGVPGSILQVQSTTVTTFDSTTSTTPEDWSGMSVSITPSSASNKVLVICNFYAGMGNTLSVGRISLARNNTPISVGTQGGSANMSHLVTSNNSDRIPTPGTITFLDSPATTSATVYKLLVSVSSSTMYLNRWGLNTNEGIASTITAIEVAA